jgi:hypothetical protein
MNDIDKSIVALALYVVFSAFFSLGYSHFQRKKDDKAPVQESRPQVAIVQQKSKSKKEKLIPDGSVALCLVCDRTFENDTYWKNHIAGQKHLKKATNFKGEICRIQKATKGK